jgi:tetratricopeptide (TPR) repeat protein
MPEADAAELIRRGKNLRDDRELEGALTSFQAALKAEPDDIDVRFEIGAVLTDLARYRSARVEYANVVATLTQVIEETPEEDRNRLSQLHNERGVAKALSGDLESSLHDFEEAITLRDEPYPEARRSAGRVLLALEHYDEAGKAFKKAIDEMHQDDANAHEGLALVHVANDDPEKALSEARKAIELGRTAGRNSKALVHLLVARALRAASGDGEAEAEATKALGEAVSICERNVEERRDPPLAMYLMAHAQLEQRDGRAVTTFAEAIDRLKSADADSRHLFAAYAGYTHALSSAERFDEALRAGQEASALEAPSAELRENLNVNLAYVLSQVEKVDKAISMIEAVQKKRSKRVEDNGKATFSPGWRILGTEGLIRLAAAEKYGDPDSWSAAVAAFERAGKAAGDSAREDDSVAYGGIRLAEGYARWQLGDLRGAARAFRNAKGHLPEGSPAQVEAEKLELRASLSQSFRLPRFLPHVTTVVALILIAASTVLEATQNLNPAAWASVVLGLALLAVASWCLPMVRTLRIGGAELTKEISIKESVPFVDMSRGPIMGGPGPVDIPRYAPPNTSNVEAPGKVMGDKDLEEATDLKNAVALGRQKADSDANDVVRRALRQAFVYALGEPAGDVKPGEGTESDLLHFTIDDPETGKEVVLLPVFTASDPMREALLRNPDWRTLSVLQIEGGTLVDNVDHDVRIVIDPWTNDEHQLPSRDETDHASDEPSVEGPDMAEIDRSAEEGPPHEH